MVGWVVMEPVKDINLKDVNVDGLLDQFKAGGGFVAKHVAVASDVFGKMLNDKECVKFLSFPAAIIATGCRGVVKDLVKEKKVDVIITTCGTLDHDLARCWKDYYHGSFGLDDKELHQKGLNRLGNVLVPNESYGVVLEEKLLPILEEIYAEKKVLSTMELCWEIGKRLDNEDSILYWAAKNKIPIFVPGITDGSVGSQIWMFRQKHPDFMIDVFKDEEELSKLVFNAKKSGALMVGGGISKHHTIWWNQFKDGLDYVIAVTTAVEYDGSLSGARVNEAISWGKVKEDATHVTVEGDATVMLPLVVGKFLTE
jgi:deoxyhypusine synthase